jgi:hypothetical protein
MDCPVCGCPVDEPVEDFLAGCGCCGTIWLVAEDHHTLDHVLVGAEG